jgi:hypothetical protein
VKVLRAIANALCLFIRILIYEWLPALVAIFKSLRDMIRRSLVRRRLPGREGKASDERCMTVPRGRIKHPDPLIYSQTELMKLGLAVTWDNPDVQLYRNGAPVSSWELDPATEYEVVARVWNKSTDAPVIGLPVIFSMLSFGVGTKLTAIGATSIPELGVKGGPNHPAFARIMWTTPPTPGHYCLQVQLDSADDADRGNNLGAENTLVGQARSPAEFTFELRNDTLQDQTYRFELDSYRVPPMRHCDEPVREPPADHQEPAGPRMPTPALRVPALHDRRNFPIPADWTVTIAPNSPELASNASIPVKVAVTPPAGFSGRQPINVNAFHGLGFAGGVTLYVDAD